MSTPTPVRRRHTSSRSWAARVGKSAPRSWWVPRTNTFGKVVQRRQTEFQRDESRSRPPPVRGWRHIQDRATWRPSPSTRRTHTAGLHWCMSWRCGLRRRTRLFMARRGCGRGRISPAGMLATLYDMHPEGCWPRPTRYGLFMANDYGPNGRESQWETTVARKRRTTVHVGRRKDEGGFVKFAHLVTRCAGLAMPRSDHPVAAGQHARRRDPDRQGRARRC